MSRTGSPTAKTDSSHAPLRLRPSPRLSSAPGRSSPRWRAMGEAARETMVRRYDLDTGSHAPRPAGSPPDVRDDPITRISRCLYATPPAHSSTNASSGTSSRRRTTSESVRWMGQPIWQNVLDLWTIQETIVAVRPDLLIECGTNRGGSSLFFAHLFDLHGARARDHGRRGEAPRPLAPPHQLPHRQLHRSRRRRRGPSPRGALARHGHGDPRQRSQPRARAAGARDRTPRSSPKRATCCARTG